MYACFSVMARIVASVVLSVATGFDLLNSQDIFNCKVEANTSLYSIKYTTVLNGKMARRKKKRCV